MKLKKIFMSLVLAFIPAASTDHPKSIRSPGPGVTVIGVLMALWCIAFAVVNIVFEVTDHFAGGPLAEYTAGITVMNWLVVGFKALGAAVALLSIANIPKLHLPALMTVL
ncbi:MULTISPECIES: hypothetical protein [Bacillus]|uniref:Uncharacterized protein n=2 Tax=Bacillus TaxID=1386 RepID=A0A0M4FXP3_9BACI|nr:MULTISPECIES: hypothetical protein [Bacillus]ALC81925.1 hypothetical protein AM592_10140 [Bacillus gobiensis]MBP1083248.1 hypothetical protein [Bacillus capparidis]MED1097685.1 hypothetical protein [Bacillus capparidis]